MLLVYLECVDEDHRVRLICRQEAHEVLMVGTCHLPDVIIRGSYSKFEVLVILVQWDPHPIL